jgi:hypothetical protein
VPEAAEDEEFRLIMEITLETLQELNNILLYAYTKKDEM